MTTIAPVGSVPVRPPPPALSPVQPVPEVAADRPPGSALAQGEAEQAATPPLPVAVQRLVLDPPPPKLLSREQMTELLLLAVDGVEAGRGCDPAPALAGGAQV